MLICLILLRYVSQIINYFEASSHIVVCVLPVFNAERPLIRRLAACAEVNVYNLTGSKFFEKLMVMNMVLAAGNKSGIYTH